MTLGVLIAYVDDLLAAAEQALTRKLLNAVRRKWKCGEIDSAEEKSVLFPSIRITRMVDGS